MGDEMDAPYYGVNEHMKPQFNKRLKRNQLLDFMRQQITKR
jgi:hypothetical protein